MTKNNTMLRFFANNMQRPLTYPPSPPCPASRKIRTRSRRQTLIKLERWLDAVEFCDRALHVDGKCVKALSRRASAFVKLAGECPASSSFVGAVDTTAVAAKPMPTPTPTPTPPPTPTSTEIEVVKGGAGSGCSVDVSSPTVTAEISNESVSATGAAGETGQEEGGEKTSVHHVCERYESRNGLMALALLDLEAAVEADPDGEDVRRQRDALSQEIEEEKVGSYEKSFAAPEMLKGRSR